MKNLKVEKIRAYFLLDDIYLVDRDKVIQANEDRLYFEIFFGVGLALLGNAINNPSILSVIPSITFLSIGLLFIRKYIKKNIGLTTSLFQIKEKRMPNEKLPGLKISVS